MPTAAKSQISSILGEHPVPPSLFGEILTSADGFTRSRVPHRALREIEAARSQAVNAIGEMLICHHASEQALRRTRELGEALRELGVPQNDRLLRFPTNPTTRKGNLAEVVLAEYIVAAAHITVPVYRLRYNPNVNQSMKGDDVLAFDLESDPVRVVVGEAKFRGVPSRSAIEEIVDCLARSHRGGVPISLQFVADRLFELGSYDLGKRVMQCAILFATDKLRLDYVGLMLSDQRTAALVSTETPSAFRRLVVISLGVTDPDTFAAECFTRVE